MLLKRATTSTSRMNKNLPVSANSRPSTWQDPNISNFARIFANYPELFHYAWPGSLMDILESNGLLARLATDFKDQEEYALGLRLILDRLKMKGFAWEVLLRCEPVSLGLLGGQSLDSIGDMIDRTIGFIENEIKGSENSKISVYVASLSTRCNEPKMLRNYGGCVIHFNRLLPMLAYSRPRPFLSSMLTRVTYDKSEFQAHVAEVFNVHRLMDLREAEHALKDVATMTYRDAIAFWIAEGLCMLAPNLKMPEFAYEMEWRLKSVYSPHSQSMTNYRQRDDRSRFGLPAEAEMKELKQNTPPRYLHRLAIRGRFVGYNVECFGDDANGVSSTASTWMKINSLGSLDLSQAVDYWMSIDKLHQAAPSGGPY